MYPAATARSPTGRPARMPAGHRATRPRGLGRCRRAQCRRLPSGLPDRWRRRDLSRAHRPAPLRPRPGGARDRHAPRRHAPLRAGDISTNHPLAEVLDLVARDGSSVMTIGEVGRALVATWPPTTDSSPPVTSPSTTRPCVCPCVGGSATGVRDQPPPSVGGPMLAVMLGEMASAPDGRAPRDWADIIGCSARSCPIGSRSDVARDRRPQGHELLLSVDRRGLG